MAPHLDPGDLGGYSSPCAIEQEKSLVAHHRNQDEVDLVPEMIASLPSFWSMLQTSERPEVTQALLLLLARVEEAVNIDVLALVGENTVHTAKRKMVLQAANLLLQTAWDLETMAAVCEVMTTFALADIVVEEDMGHLKSQIFAPPLLVAATHVEAVVSYLAHVAAGPAWGILVEEVVKAQESGTDCLGLLDWFMRSGKTPARKTANCISKDEKLTSHLIQSLNSHPLALDVLLATLSLTEDTSASPYLPKIIQKVLDLTEPLSPLSCYRLCYVFLLTLPHISCLNMEPVLLRLISWLPSLKRQDTVSIIIRLITVSLFLGLATSEGLELTDPEPLFKSALQSYPLWLDFHNAIFRLNVECCYLTCALKFGPERMEKTRNTFLQGRNQLYFVSSLNRQLRTISPNTIPRLPIKELQPFPTKPSTASSTLPELWLTGERDFADQPDYILLYQAR